MATRRATTLLWLLIGIRLAFQLPSPAAASCNTMPPGPRPFGGARGTVDRPFLRPGGDVTLTTGCGHPPPFPGPPAQLSVTIIAKSPATDSLEFKVTAESTVELSFKVPDKVPGNRPDFAGPVAIAVTDPAAPQAGQPPLSDLAGTPCRKFQRSDLVVCIDELFPRGSCGLDVDPEFPALTALPRQNEFQKMCRKGNEDPPQCDEAADPSYEVRYTLDTNGNVLLSMDWGKILPPKSPGSALKARRWLQGSVLEAFLSRGAPTPIEIPGAAFLDSFNEMGGSFSGKPIFEPGDLPTPTPPPGQTATTGPTATPTPKRVAFHGTADQGNIGIADRAPETLDDVARLPKWRARCTSRHRSSAT